MTDDPMDNGTLGENVGRRLMTIRLALGLNQEEFGGSAGLQQSRYSQYETGERPLTIVAALKLCQVHNLTLDWLYRGDPSGLPHWMASHVKAAQKKHKHNKE